MPPGDRFIASAEFYVRYAETDAQGIVHHASYVVWLEESRSHYSRTVGRDYAEFERSGYLMSVVEVNMRYRAPSRYGDRVLVSCWIEEVKSRSVAFGYEVTIPQSGVLCAKARTSHICLTREGIVTSWPDSWKEWLSEGLGKNS
jgi:acyl-CoA thioester hydrolase